MYEEITAQAKQAVLDILEKANLKEGSIFIVGCSSSTVAGKSFGTASSMEIAQAIFDGIFPELKKRNIYIAAQCCEHLNRAIVIEKSICHDNLQDFERTRCCGAYQSRCRNRHRRCSDRNAFERCGCTAYSFCKKYR